MAIAREEGMTAADVAAANAAVNRARIANAPATRTTTTANERSRESGQRYGSDNTAAPVGVAPAPGLTPAPTGDGDKNPPPGGDDKNPPPGGDKNPPPADTGLTPEQQDAFALIKDVFASYGLESMYGSIEKLMKNNVGPNQASLMLKTDPLYNAEYLKRFDGNKKRKDAGLNVLSEAEYLDLESSYKQTLKAYGQANYFGANKDIAMDKMAELIGGDVSAVEFKDRVDTVVTRVNNADPSIKETLTSFFDIKDADLVSYFLNPKDNLPKLQEKVTAAEIGAAAKGQNLATSADAATALAKFGVTRAQALEGYSTIGEIMPTANKLSSIYGGDKYDQATAEEEVFKGTASAKRKRQQLTEREVNAFSGTSGRLRTGQQRTNQGSF